MARNRMINPEFWLDEELAKLSPYARLLYIGLWAICDDNYATLPCRPEWIKAQVFPYEEVSIRGILGELSGSGKLVKFAINGKEFYWIKNFFKYQKVEKPSLPKYAEYKPEFEVREKQSVSSRGVVVAEVKIRKVKISKDKKSISKEIGADAPKPKRGREDINIVLEGIKKIVSILDGSQKEQRFMVKNFIDSKAPEILRQSGVMNPTAEQVHNAIFRIFQLAKKDEFHSKNCTSIKYVYNKAGSIVMSSKKRKEVWVC